MAIFLIYSQLSGTRLCNFQKNPSQKFSTEIIESSLVYTLSTGQSDEILKISDRTDPIAIYVKNLRTRI